MPSLQDYLFGHHRLALEFSILKLNPLPTAQLIHVGMKGSRGADRGQVEVGSCLPCVIDQNVWFGDIVSSLKFSDARRQAAHAERVENSRSNKHVPLLATFSFDYLSGDHEHQVTIAVALSKSVRRRQVFESSHARLAVVV